MIEAATQCPTLHWGYGAHQSLTSRLAGGLVEAGFRAFDPGVVDGVVGMLHEQVYQLYVPRGLVVTLWPVPQHGYQHLLSP